MSLFKFYDLPWFFFRIQVTITMTNHIFKIKTKSCCYEKPKMLHWAVFKNKNERSQNYLELTSDVDTIDFYSAGIININTWVLFQNFKSWWHQGHLILLKLILLFQKPILFIQYFCLNLSSKTSTLNFGQFLNIFSLNI